MTHRHVAWCAFGAVAFLTSTPAAFAAPAPPAPTARPAPPAPKPSPPPAGEAKAGATPPPPAAEPGQPSDCPPGAYCEPAEMIPPEELANAEVEAAATSTAGETATAGTTVHLPPPPPGADPNAPRWVYVQPSPDGGPGQVIVYEPGRMPPPSALPPVRPVPPPPPPPPQKEWHREREWGLNIRLDGLILPRHAYQYENDANGAGLIGMGMSLRYRPIPFFAVDLSGDFMVGVDGNGLERREIPVGLSALFYFNPDDVAQFYAFAGPEFTFAQVFADEPEPQLADRTSDEYNYLGGHIGVGVEIRVSELVGINLDGYGLLRTRTDDDYGGRYPEYYDARTGDSSNTSGALMLRGGATFWF